MNWGILIDPQILNRGNSVQFNCNPLLYLNKKIKQIGQRAVSDVDDYSDIPEESCGYILHLPASQRANRSQKVAAMLMQTRFASTQLFCEGVLIIDYF